MRDHAAITQKQPFSASLRRPTRRSSNPVTSAPPYELALRSAPNAILITDARDKIVLFNPSAEKIFGYSESEVIGKTLSLLIAPGLRGDRSANRKRRREIPGRGARAPGISVVAARKAGSEIPLELRFSPIQTRSGRFTIASISDVSERRETELELNKERKLLSTIFDASPAFFCALDSRGAVIMMNRSLLEATGYRLEEVYGTHYFSTFLPRGDREAIEALFMKSIESHKVLVIETPVLTKGGKKLLVQWRSQAIYSENGAIDFVCGFGIDITERRRLEQEVLDISEREQQKMGQNLHDTVSQTLVGLSFKAKLLEKKLADKNLSEARDASEVSQLISESLGQAYSLARGLYPVELERHGLMYALKELAGNVREKQDISCTVNVDASAVISDRAVAVQVFRIAQEAVNNAVKHAKAGRISIVLKPVSAGFELTVEDDGLGLPPHCEDAAGMGMHIMRYRASMIGATLRLDSTPGGGTAVICRAEGYHVQP